MELQITIEKERTAGSLNQETQPIGEKQENSMGKILGAGRSREEMHAEGGGGRSSVLGAAQGGCGGGGAPWPGRRRGADSGNGVRARATQGHLD